MTKLIRTKLLLHTCCGPCFLGVWEELANHVEIDTALYFDNDNIYPEVEWEKRRANLRIAAKEKNVSLIEVGYNNNLFKQEVAAITTEFAARCIFCYKMRLEKVVKYAKENGYDAISTTLLVSPYQQHEKLKEVISDLAKSYGTEFYYTDWRPYFREGQKTAKEMDLYRQKYCGCIYSLNESKAK